MKDYWIINPKLNNYRPSKISVAITATMYKEPPLVLDIPKLINTQSKFMKNIFQNTEISATSLKSTQQSFPTLTSLSVDSPVKHLALLEKEGDLTTQEELYSLTSQGFSKSKDPNSSYWKTSKCCYLMTLDELSKPSSPRLLNWGMTSNGKCLTQRISESPKIGKECSLSDVLEDSVDEKYFLSEKQVKSLIRPKNYQ